MKKFNQAIALSCARILLAGVVLFDSAGLALAKTDEKAKAPAERGAWQPAAEDPQAFRDIVDFNIFMPDRRKIADKVDRDRNPPPPHAITTKVEEVADEPPPPSEDSFWRFSGTGQDAEGLIVFIENIKSGELVRVTGPAVISLGKVTQISNDAIVYVVDSEQRTIRVGESLLGVRITPPGATLRTTSSSSSGSTSGSSGSALDRLRELRERRARELGNAPPAEPAPSGDTPAAPAAESDPPQSPSDQPAN